MSKTRRNKTDDDVDAGIRHFIERLKADDDVSLEMRHVIPRLLTRAYDDKMPHDCDVCGKSHEGDCRRGTGLRGELKREGLERAVAVVQRSLDGIRGERDREYIARSLNHLAREIEISPWHDELRQRYVDDDYLWSRLTYQPSWLKPSPRVAERDEPLDKWQTKMLSKYRTRVRSQASAYCRQDATAAEQVELIVLELFADQLRRWEPGNGCTFDAYAERFLSGAIAFWAQRPSTEREKLMLAPRFRDPPSVQLKKLGEPLTPAQAELVLNHQPIVKSLARECSQRKELVCEDLEAFGLEMLIALSREYDRSRSVTFGAFAQHRLLGAMQDRVKFSRRFVRAPIENALLPRSGRKAAAQPDHTNEPSKGADVELAWLNRNRPAPPSADQVGAVDSHIASGGAIHRHEQPRFLDRRSSGCLIAKCA